MTRKINPPIIQPVAESSRPLWSVMIPTYNNIDYLAQTLESVLVQDPGVDQMQIEVVDNCSTEGDIEAFVQNIGKGRVAFHRHPESVGGCMHNFNACIRRSRGELVHILHSDDYVEPGFYETYSQAAATHPETMMFICRVFDVDEAGEIEGLSPRLPYLEQPGDPSPQFYVNDIRFPGVVMRRSLYEKTGGFYEHIIHAHDWEMWMRAIQPGAALSINKPLAYYRVFDGSDTSKMVRTAAGLRDILQVGDVFAQQYPGFDHRRFIADIRQRAFWKAGDFLRANDPVATQSNAQLWWELATPSDQVKLVLTMFLRAEKTSLWLVNHLAMNWLVQRVPAIARKPQTDGTVLESQT
jgi:glycosyltransferase involved in cell wall biosynthesis